MNKLDHRDGYVSGCLVSLSAFDIFTVYWSRPDSRVEYDLACMCIHNTNVPALSCDGQPSLPNSHLFIVSISRT
jgi:hypothetical protein